MTLSGHELSTKIIGSILKNCPNITDLTILDGNISLIISLVSGYSLKYLTCSLKNDHINDLDLEVLGKNAPHTLEHLDLMLYKELNLAKFFENCKANLKVLILGNFNQSGLNAIIKYMEERRSLRIIGKRCCFDQELKESLKEKYNVYIIESDELCEWTKWY